MMRKIWISRDKTSEDYVIMWLKKPTMRDGLSYDGKANAAVQLADCLVWVGFIPKRGTCHEVIIDHSDVTPEVKK